MHEEMRAIDIFLSHSRAHMHWIGQHLQAETGRVSKKSLQNDGVLIGMISETDHWSCVGHA